MAGKAVELLANASSEADPRPHQASLKHAHGTTLQRPAILLFGDSITERSFDHGGWGARLAHRLHRRADIMNRGFGGYNSKWAAYLLPSIVAEFAGSPPLLATVFLGANDAASPTGGGGKQALSLAEYGANLGLMVDYLRAHGVTRIIVLTPPPIHEAGRREHHAQKGLSDQLEIDRTNARTETYAQAALQAAAKANVPAVDLWHGLQDVEEWGTKYTNDGLHLTPKGNERVFHLLLAVLESNFPELSPEKLPLHFHDWSNIHFADPTETFGPLDPALTQPPGDTSAAGVLKLGAQLPA